MDRIKLKLHSSLVPVLINFMLMLFIFFFTGCSEDFISNNNSVNGRIIDYHGFFIPGLSVSTGKPPVSTTDFYGSFHLEPVNIPYNLKVNWADEFFSFYQGLSVANPQITLPLSLYADYRKNVVGKFPPVKQGNNAVIGFISKNNFEIDLLIFANSGDTTAELILFYNDPSELLEGYIYYMGYAIKNYGYLESYDNFGMKYAKLNDVTTIINFTEEEIAYNPPEQTINCTVNNVEGNLYNNAYLNFKGYSPASKYMIDGDFGHTNFDIVFPENLPVDFNIMVSSSLSLNRKSNTKFIYLEPGENGYIQHKPFLSLSSPDDSCNNINDATVFSFNASSLDAVNIFEFSYLRNTKYYDFLYYTKSHSVTYSQLKEAGLTLLHTDKISWYANQICSFNSMDEFAEKYLYTNSKYTDYLRSERRTFSVP